MKLLKTLGFHQYSLLELKVKASAAMGQSARGHAMYLP
jgi:hypothetical protein